MTPEKCQDMVERVPLRQIASFFSGGTPSKAEPAYWRGNIPWVSPKDMGDDKITDAEDHISDEAVSDSATRIVPKGSILVVVRSGILIRRFPVALTMRPVAFNQDIKALVANTERCLPDYLFWYLKANERFVLSEGVKKGATVHSLSAGFMENLVVPIPPLPEQRRIVDILNHAASIRRLRDEARAKAREIIPALFVEMFGDPATNPKGWEVKKMSELGSLDRGKSKHRPRNDRILFGGAYPFIQTGDVANSGGAVNRYTETYSERGLWQSKLWPAGTLCITIAANIAKTGILTFDACFPDSVVGFTPNGISTTRYVQYFLHFLQPYLEKSAPQLAQKNINLEILRDIDIPAPPHALQQEFADRVAEVEGINSLNDKAVTAAAQMTQSLLSSAFDPVA